MEVYRVQNLKNGRIESIKTCKRHSRYVEKSLEDGSDKFLLVAYENWGSGKNTFVMGKCDICRMIKKGILQEKKTLTEINQLLY